MQLVGYSLRKRAERSDEPLSELLRRVRLAVIRKGWDLDAGELQWVMQNVAVGLGGSPADASGHGVDTPEGFVNGAAAAGIESVVDRALSRQAWRGDGDV